MLSGVPMYKKAGMCFTEKIHELNKLPSDTSYSAVTLSSILMNQQYILNKLSSNRNTHKTRVCTDLLTKML